MLKSKRFTRKTRKGNVVSIQREIYLRDDIWSGLPPLTQDHPDAFLDPAQPESPYGCTYNCINALDNCKTFNDGYHIVHHVNSRLHWSEMPHDFMRNIQKYADQDCLVPLLT